MLSKTQWILSQLTRTLWVRASLFAILAIITALIAIPLEHYLNYKVDINIGADAVNNILNILASSMLAVTTFSLSIMVSAYAAASSSVSPRATKLVQEDTTTQNVLATFIGSFLYSLVSIIALSSHAYGQNGRLIVFIVTVGVILLIVITILRWIEHLSQLGRLGETTNKVEVATTEALEQRVKFPSLGAKTLNLNQLPDYIDKHIHHEKIGYIQHIDINALNCLAIDHDAEISILANPGDFIHLNTAVASMSIDCHEELIEKIQATFSIGTDRSFDQDPGFGINVLTEIASRALSSAINDPGTAVDVINRSIRVLSKLKPYTLPEDNDESISYKSVRVPGLSIGRMLDDLYLPIARDGAGNIEVQIAILEALLALKVVNNTSLNDDIDRVANLVNQHAKQGLNLESDLNVVNNLLKQINQA